MKRLRMRLLLVALLAAPVLAPSAPFAKDVGAPFEPPSWGRWFGTDDLGRDLLAGVVEGARLSLSVAVGTVAVALVLGALVGVSAGYLGGVYDELLMRFIEMFQIVPRFFLALVVLTIWGYDLGLLVLVLGLTSWSGLARLARAETLSLREREWVEASRASGAHALRLLVRHLVPHAARPLVAASPLIASAAMVTEAGLSFLGLGSLEHVSWGYLLQNAQPFLLDAWWMAVFPGLAMTFTVLAMALLALGENVEVVLPRVRTPAKG